MELIKSIFFYLIYPLSGVFSPSLLIARLPLGVFGTQLVSLFSVSTCILFLVSLSLSSSVSLMYLSPVYLGLMSVTGISAILSMDVFGSSDRLLFADMDKERLEIIHYKLYKGGNTELLSLRLDTNTYVSGCIQIFQLLRQCVQHI